MKKLQAFFLMAILLVVQVITPVQTVVAAQLDKVNVDLTLNPVVAQVPSGNTAIFQLDLKLAGSQENINKEIGENPSLVVQLPTDTAQYYELQSTVEELAIDGVVPTYVTEIIELLPMLLQV